MKPVNLLLENLNFLKVNVKQNLQGLVLSNKNYTSLKFSKNLVV